MSDTKVSQWAPFDEAWSRMLQANTSQAVSRNKQYQKRQQILKKRQQQWNDIGNDIARLIKNYKVITPNDKTLKIRQHIANKIDNKFKEYYKQFEDKEKQLETREKQLETREKQLQKREIQIQKREKIVADKELENARRIARKQVILDKKISEFGSHHEQQYLSEKQFEEATKLPLFRGPYPLPRTSITYSGLSGRRTARTFADLLSKVFPRHDISQPYYLYHGTENKSRRSIKTGVSLDVNVNSVYGKGFYVSPDPKVALQYACARLDQRQTYCSNRVVFQLAILPEDAKLLLPSSDYDCNEEGNIIVLKNKKAVDSFYTNKIYILE